MLSPSITLATSWTQGGDDDRWSNAENWNAGVPVFGSTINFSGLQGPSTQTVDYDATTTALSLVARTTPTGFGTVKNITLTLDGRPNTMLTLTDDFSIDSTSEALDSGIATVELIDMHIQAGRLSVSAEDDARVNLTLINTRFDAVDSLGFGSTPENLTLTLGVDSIYSNLGSGLFTAEAGTELVFRDGGVMDWPVFTDQPTTVLAGGGSFYRNVSGVGGISLNGSSARLTFGDPNSTATHAAGISGTISGTGGVVVDSPNYTLSLLGNNSFSGGLFLKQGVVQVSAGPNLGGLSNFVQFEGGTLATTQSFTSVIDAFVGQDGGAIDTSVHNTRLEGALTGPSAANSGDLTKRGSGALTLAGNGAGFAGDWIVEQGTLVSAAGNQTFSNTTAVTIDANATLRLEGVEEFAGVNGIGQIEIAAFSPMRIGYDNSDNTFGGQISGAGNVAKWGTGRQTFTGDNSTHTGGWFLNEGSLEFASGESLGGDLVIGPNTTVFLGPGAGESAYSQSFSDASAGTGSIVFRDLGVVTLAGDSSGFTGSLAIRNPSGLGVGTLEVDGTISPSVLEIEGSGTLGGSGNILGTATALNTGTIRPAADSGRLRVDDADFRAGSVFGVDIASATEFSILRVPGDAAINDVTLDVDLLDGFTPAHGDSFLVLRVDGAVSGSGFSSFELTDVPGMTWDTSQVLSTGVLSVAVDLPGDYNLDGVVDAADYTVWRDHFGQPAGSLPSDIDGGVIGQAQYDTWVAHFNQSVPTTAAAVPEPGALVLLAVFLAEAHAAERRTRAGWAAPERGRSSGRRRRSA